MAAASGRVAKSPTMADGSGVGIEIAHAPGRWKALSGTGSLRTSLDIWN
ncbi:hypothetical protein SAMN05446935_8372 [Burkholderia sp. YR290]|nr:hypothetical protein SAMN05446935_8372 [Burkholderia sp. YR290]